MIKMLKMHRTESTGLNSFIFREQLRHNCYDYLNSFKMVSYDNCTRAFSPIPLLWCNTPFLFICFCQRLHSLQCTISATSPVSGFPPALPRQIMKHLFSLQPIRSQSLAVRMQRKEGEGQWEMALLRPSLYPAHTTITIWEMPTDGQSVIVIRLAAIPEPS